MSPPCRPRPCMGWNVATPLVFVIIHKRNSFAVKVEAQPLKLASLTCVCVRRSHTRNVKLHIRGRRTMRARQVNSQTIERRVCGAQQNAANEMHVEMKLK